ncbi:MAG: hypothetical protein K2O14_03595 [Oscillospiraceae bacterium]|nr:hypothetical protein [Oscillospiraceae bacterium]
MDELRGLWRGKRTKNGEWVEGFYFETPVGESYIMTSRQETKFVFKVIPQTLGECAGLRDKNGKPIFEGDIVTTLETDDNGKRCFPVVQSNVAFWLYDELLDSRLDFLGSYENQALEVIGNIHDNPEMIGGDSG